MAEIQYMRANVDRKSWMMHRGNKSETPICVEGIVAEFTGPRIPVEIRLQGDPRIFVCNQSDLHLSAGERVRLYNWRNGPSLAPHYDNNQEITALEVLNAEGAVTFSHTAETYSFRK